MHPHHRHLTVAFVSKTGIIVDIAITIQKARNLPVPPALCGGPIVSCAWGVADPAQQEQGRKSSLPPPTPRRSTGSTATGSPRAGATAASAMAAFETSSSPLPPALPFGGSEAPSESEAGELSVYDESSWGAPVGAGCPPTPRSDRDESEAVIVARFTRRARA